MRSLAWLTAVLVTLGCHAGAGTPPTGRAGSAGGSIITVNGAARFQTIAGFGVNGQPRNWGSGTAVKPALTTLVSEMNATLWRVEINDGLSNWEATNDDDSPSHFNWGYFDNVFANTKSFKDLWAYVRFLNALGVTNIELASHGTAPVWMGGIRVPKARFDEYVETQLAVLEYALFRIPDPKPVFRYFSAFNEPEMVEPPEGIALGAEEAASIMSKLATRIGAESAAHPELAKIKLIGPEAALDGNTAPNGPFRGLLTQSAALKPWLAAVAHHTYSPVVGHDWNHVLVPEWLTETNGFRPGADNCGDTSWSHAIDLANGTLASLNAGVSAVLVWTDYDAPHSHDRDLWETFGLLETKIPGFGMPCGERRVPTQAQLDSATYVKKPTYHAFRQLTAFARPAAVRIGAATGDSDLRVTAIVNPDKSVVVLGVNGGGPKDVTLRLSGLSEAPQALTTYTTTESAQFVEGAPVSFSGGQAGATSIPATCVFAMVARPAPGGALPPAKSRRD